MANRVRRFFNHALQRLEYLIQGTQSIGESFLARDIHHGTGNMTIKLPEIHTSRLLLRKFSVLDTENIYQIFSSRDVLQYWDSPPWTNIQQAQNFIENSQPGEHEQTGFRLAVDELATGQLIGQCSVFEWNRSFRSIKIGYCFRVSSWGQGIATECAGAVLKWAFDNLDINRVQAETDTRNDASGRVLTKLGFVREGTLREDCIVNGKVTDSHVYGLLRRDWQRAASTVD